MATPVDYTPDGAAVYACNPAINTECSKTNCFLNGGPCSRTLDPKFALTEGTGHMIAWFNVAWATPKLRPMEIGTEGYLSTVYLSDPVLVYTDEGEQSVCRYERDPDTGFEGFITEDGAQPTVTHWTTLPKPPGRKG